MRLWELMNKRTFLQALTGVITAPLVVFGTSRNSIIPKIKIFKTLGKIKDINWFTEIDYNHFHEDLEHYRRIMFPTETTVKITGEHGELTYSTFNLKILDQQALHLNPWDFINKIEENTDPVGGNIELKYTSELKYKSNRFKLCSIVLFNKIEYHE